MSNTLVDITDNEYFQCLKTFRAAEDEFFTDQSDETKAQNYQRAYGNLKRMREQRERERREAAK